MAIYVWSDTHFGHAGVIKHCARTRPYATVHEMNEALIERWNEKVSDRDDIYLLGDFAFRSPGTDIGAIFCALNGRKHLVIGNHDEQNPAVLRLPWKSQHNLVTLREEGVRAIACHYPLETWKGAHKGYLMLHGHSHGTLKRKIPHRYDVGADAEWWPVSLQGLAEHAAAQAFDPTDHHGDS